jgi:hypothetical protein
MVRASYYLPATAALIPTGALADVTETPFDFRHATAIGMRRGGQYDHTFVIDPASQSPSVRRGCSTRAAADRWTSARPNLDCRFIVETILAGFASKLSTIPTRRTSRGFRPRSCGLVARYHSATAFVFGIDGIALSSADLGSRGRDRLR